MPVVRCACLVALTTTMSAVGLSTAGCGAGRPAQATPQQRLAAAILSEDDVPAGYLPAENAAMFRGLRTADPDCRALFTLAGTPALGALGAVPRADTAFYQVDPGGFVAEHLLRAPPIPAHEFLIGVRRAATGCDRIVLRSGSDTIGLRRAPFPVRGVGEESYTVRYAGRAGARHRLHLDIVAARPANGLLVLVSETLAPRRKARDVAHDVAHDVARDVDQDVAVLIAERAVAKLRGAASIG